MLVAVQSIFKATKKGQRGGVREGHARHYAAGSGGNEHHVRRGLGRGHHRGGTPGGRHRSVGDTPEGDSGSDGVETHHHPSPA